MRRILFLTAIITGLLTKPGTCQAPADVPVARTDRNSQKAHQDLLEKARQGHIRLYFEGDSITRRWGALDRPALLANWQANFRGWDAADFGWGADKIQNILWRIRNGELDGVNPKVVVLLAGTNNIGKQYDPATEAATVDNVVRGIQALLQEIKSKAPAATIVLTAIFPRNDNPDVMKAIDAIDQRLATLAEGATVRFLNINRQLADGNGRLYPGVMDPDMLHPALKGYQVWADALKPILTELLGARAAEDHAPPPSGDPAALKRRAANEDARSASFPN